MSPSDKNRIYIVPTWYGLIYVAGLLIAFFQGALHDNHVVYLLGFCFSTFFLVGMFQTNNNLKGIEVTSIETTPAVADGHVPITIRIRNVSAEPRFALGVQFVVGNRKYRVFTPLLAKGAAREVSLVFPSHARGHYPTPRIQAFTTFPLGLFFAWKWKNPESEYFIYPKPIGNRSPPLRGGGAAAGGRTLQSSGDDFSGHRPYQRGDSQRLIDWKARARKLPWLVKKFDEGESGSRVLRWEDLSDLPMESRLCQLSLWVHECERRQETYSLSLPGSETAVGYGRRHFFDCLRRLATYSPPGTRQEVA